MAWQVRFVELWSSGLVGARTGRQVGVRYGHVWWGWFRPGSAGVAVLVMLCRGEAGKVSLVNARLVPAGEFRHVKGREVWTVEAGGARSGELW